MHPRLDGGGLDPQGLGDLGVREPVDVVQEKGRAVLLRELVDGRAKYGLQLGLEDGSVSLGDQSIPGSTDSPVWSKEGPTSSHDTPFRSTRRPRRF